MALCSCVCRCMGSPSCLVHLNGILPFQCTLCLHVALLLFLKLICLFQSLFFGNGRCHQVFSSSVRNKSICFLVFELTKLQGSSHYRADVLHLLHFVHCFLLSHLILSIPFLRAVLRDHLYQRRKAHSC